MINTIFLLLVRTITLCEDERRDIECPPDHVIDVIVAFYGRYDLMTCPKEGSMGNRSCSSMTAGDYFRGICRNKRKCSIDRPMHNPCYGTYKYIRVKFLCRGK